MILDLDAGNTRCKWRIADDKKDVRKSGNSTLEQLCAAPFDEPGIRRVRVSSVRGPEADAMIARWAASNLGLNAEFASATRCLGQVVNGYTDPERLGVDRWLAILAGFDEVRGAVGVVDCGSALTADLVDKDGLHCGGFIAPGLAMMRQSLLSGTDKIRFAPNQRNAGFVPGRDTGEAVCNGALVAATGFVAQAIERFREICGDPVILMTGGDAELIQQQLQFSINLRPSLVLDGLDVALP
ncbi:MAG: type III pantothenate kinase [Gammaproteobacteria bacterium]|nr:type III pantothenate kinase [Gammaproteobacteria bacterium]MBK6581416.1 type III pantothenate kinase [Gammaproteobacteria bacterium]MBK7518634.1 type III pantothenate kinase [Gammaproteobacteria bacterium]MBK8307390.1 type III pantothenate kinase [Gammaproteobacteria bacterium]MBK9665124.1 type III pantothenate kinase [Gammaproteobacteria bacterium]